MGNAALKKMHQILSLEDVERIMDETREGIEVQQEIDAILSGGLTSQDEDDVAAELDQILAQVVPVVILCLLSLAQVVPVVILCLLSLATFHFLINIQGAINVQAYLFT